MYKAGVILKHTNMTFHFSRINCEFKKIIIQVSLIINDY